MKIPQYLQHSPNTIFFTKDTVLTQLPLSTQVTNNQLSITLNSETPFQSFVFHDYHQFQEITFTAPKTGMYQLSIISHYTKNVDCNFSFIVEDHASVSIDWISINGRATHSNLKRTYHLGNHSFLQMNQGLFLKGTGQIHDQSYLEGIEASFVLHNLHIASNQDKLHLIQEVFHQQKNTSSHIENNLVSNQFGSLDYEVSGHILKGNAGSVCRQQNRGLILGEKAIISVDPKLLIDEYDVEASHGAAIGQINEEELFYLLSRGLTLEQSKRLIVSGYTQPFVSKIEDKKLKQAIQKRIQVFLKGVDSFGKE